MKEEEAEPRVIARGRVEAPEELLDPARLAVERPLGGPVRAERLPDLLLEVLAHRLASEAAVQCVPQELHVVLPYS